MIESYKAGQGVVTRRVAFWGLAVLVIWAGQSLYTWMIGTLDFSKDLIFEKGRPIEGWVVPILEQRVNWAFLATWVFALGSCYLIYFLLNRPKVADFLVETDSELKKVTWPSWSDAKNSTVIVIIFVLFLTTFLVICDAVLSRVFNLVLG